MTPESEMQHWQREWRAVGDAPPADPRMVQQSVARYRKRSRIVLFANLAFAAVMVAGSIYAAIRVGGREIVAWATYVCLSTVVAAWMSLNQWHQVLDACAESVADYSAFCRRRARADLRKLKAGAAFLLLQTAVGITWLATDLSTSRISRSRYELAILILAAIALAWAVVFFSNWRKVKRELYQISAETATRVGGEGPEE